MVTYIIVTLFLFGMFLPTSLNYRVINYDVPYLLLSLIGFLILVFLRKKLPKTRFFIALSIMVVLLLSTLISPFSEYSYGAFFPILGFSLLFCLRLKGIKFSEKVIKLFVLVNIINIVLGLLIVIDNVAVKDLFMNYYAAYYDNLLPSMLFKNKPVLFFSSHSRAAFHLFLFFFVSFVAYKHTRKKLFLFFSFFYTILIFHLSSNTGYLFFGMSVLMLGIYLARYRFKPLLYSSIIVAIVSAFNHNRIITELNIMFLDLNTTLSSNSNGLAGRFSQQGILADNINFMFDNLFRPVGLGYSNELFFSDSGFILYTLRGTIVLSILVYVGLYLFLRKNLDYKYQAVMLFLAFFLMDFGTPTLTYFRTLFILPFLIVILNTLSERMEIMEVSKNTRSEAV